MRHQEENKTRKSLTQTLKEAFASEKYLIAISYIDPKDKEKIHHFVTTNNFPKNDIIPSLDECFKLLQKEL